MQYKLLNANPLSRSFEIEIKIENIEQSSLELKLPQWRPGRYTFQNFSKNIISFVCLNEKGKRLAFSKQNPYTWKVDTQDCQTAWVRYTYYANQFDAGGCYVLDNLIYINWICCAMTAVGYEKESCSVDLGTKWPVATSLKLQNGFWIAENYDQLVDSPCLASPDIQKIAFTKLNRQFFCWFYGNVSVPEYQIRDVFGGFVEEQVKIFDELPLDEYHFIFLILPYRFYHGVEHENSTVIVLGPDSEFDTDELRSEFYGVSSHEFFHLWNVKRLRPKELVFYDYYTPKAFSTGFVIEGITTYYGDLTLARCGFFSFDGLSREFNERFAKHFGNLGRFNSTLYDSSIDLWIDGYTNKVPLKGVSIYDKGMIVAMILDLEIRRASMGKSSMDDLMKELWVRYKQTGYHLEDFYLCVNRVAGSDLTNLMDVLLLTCEPLEAYLLRALEVVGCGLSTAYSPNPLQTHYGARTTLDGFGSWMISAIHPESPAARVLSVGDVLHSYHSQKLDQDSVFEDLFSATSDSLQFTIIRNFEIMEVQLNKTETALFFPTYLLEFKPKASSAAKTEFGKWCGIDPENILPKN
jgi:predicted metalloprotease with PDZ domain